MNNAFSAGIAALMLSIVLSPVVLPRLRNLRMGQQIRQDGPQSHLAKSGTPTMGGILFLVSALIASIAFAGKETMVWAVWFITIGYAILGFLDDYIKVVKKRSLGLNAREKLLGQIVLAILFTWWALDSYNTNTSLWIPIFNYQIELGWSYYLLTVFILVGTTNAVNLTDGLDGLAAGVTVCSTLAFAFIASMADRPALVVVNIAMTGALLGFLKYNRHPAKVFMGDTGSLALGAFLAATAILTGTEILLAIVGTIYVAEAISVIIQVGYFKITGGKRIFRMSPLHHHFELGGWSEVKVVRVFYFIAAISGTIGVLIMYWFRPL